jgi:hypothetical protein
LLIVARTGLDVFDFLRQRLRYGLDDLQDKQRL